MKTLIGCITLFGIVLVFLLIDILASKPESFNAIVLDKQYKAERNSYSRGYGMTSGGKSGIIIMSQYESEEFNIIAKCDNNNIITVKCKPSIYYSKELGDTIECVNYKGYFTNLLMFSKGIK